MSSKSIDLWSEKNIAKYSYNHRWNLLDIRYFSIWYQTYYIPFLIASPIGWKISIRFLHLHSAVPPHWAFSSQDVFSIRMQYATRKLDPVSLYGSSIIFWIEDLCIPYILYLPSSVMATTSSFALVTSKSMFDLFCMSSFRSLKSKCCMEIQILMSAYYYFKFIDHKILNVVILTYVLFWGDCWMLVH